MVASVEWRFRRAVQNVGHHIHARHQVELLKDHCAVRLPGAFLTAFQLRYIAAFEQNLTLSRIRQPVDHPQQGRLARTRTPDDANHARLVHIQRCRIHGRILAKALGQFLDPQHVPPPIRVGGQLQMPVNGYVSLR